MFASRVLITAGTPGHMYLEDRQAKCLTERQTDRRFQNTGYRLRDGVRSSGQDSRHGLVDGLDAVAHGKLVRNLLRYIVKVDLPAVVSAGFGDPDSALTQHVGGVVEQVLQRDRAGALQYQQQ